MSKRITWGMKYGTSRPDDPEPFDPGHTGTGELVRGKLVPDPREAAIAELEAAARALLNGLKQAGLTKEYEGIPVKRLRAALAAVGGGE